jgi:hypothetical protein
LVSVIVKSAPATGAISAAASAAPSAYARFETRPAQPPPRVCDEAAAFEPMAFPIREQFFMAKPELRD